MMNSDLGMGMGYEGYEPTMNDYSAGDNTYLTNPNSAYGAANRPPQQNRQQVARVQQGVHHNYSTPPSQHPMPRTHMPMHHSTPSYDAQDQRAQRDFHQELHPGKMIWSEGPRPSNMVHQSKTGGIVNTPRDSRPQFQYDSPALQKHSYQREDMTGATPADPTDHSQMWTGGSHGGMWDSTNPTSAIDPSPAFGEPYPHNVPHQTPKGARPHDYSAQRTPSGPPSAQRTAADPYMMSDPPAARSQ
eukprot:CAMPEP_0113670918 /NCGR_PEP_ID=MMETSP0038_2-20120614/5413_1 /TAXON_ID=2898 /ORGANISM="Cryptomonas paramecium" /LENGTH=244 /DNA_ID=CAMNT_0000587007 /DNA_START=6 /DNA_END=737 /DNA_ORIENTATION=- /assembly_acc=CAM_ASM_000170